MHVFAVALPLVSSTAEVASLRSPVSLGLNKV
uniref:Uncharacterized protein n=1 Tax=Anguilla anguilla TaxID=7936 RepID=A0A0E9UYW9_ANGAN